MKTRASVTAVLLGLFGLGGCDSEGDTAPLMRNDGGLLSIDGGTVDAPAPVDAAASDTATADVAQPAPDSAPSCVVLDGGTGVDGSLPTTSTVLYTNDFETPNVPIVVNCGNGLDSRSINQLYGTASFTYSQVNTVEAVVTDDPGNLYSDPTGTGRNYALGMLSSAQDDKLALTFTVTGKPFLNVGFHLSSIDVQGCGGPFGVAPPIMRVSLHESATAIYNFGAPGKQLATGTVTGQAAPNAWTFAWTYGIVSLDSRSVTTPYVAVVFDLEQSGYAAFDNLSVTAAMTSDVVDRDNDGIPDDVVVCRSPTDAHP